MASNRALINGDSHSWSQVDINILGRTIEGISAINYGASQIKEDHAGRGTKAVSRGRGKKTYSGSITISEAEISAIENALPAGRDLMDIAPFPIVVSFDRNGTFTVHKLLSCEFMDRGVEMNTDTTNVERQLNLIIADINYKGI